MEENTNVLKINQTNSMENSPIISSVQGVIFHNDSVSLFIFKKTERIATALYIISEFLSDTEPMKFTIKDIANNLIKESLNLSNKNPNSDKSSIILLKNFTNISFLISLIRDMGNVSNMNANILIEEINKIVAILLKTCSKTDSQPRVFGQGFFAVGPGVKENNFGSDQFIKDTNRTTFEDLEDTPRTIKDTIKDNVFYNNMPKKDLRRQNVIKDKNDRQEIIVAMLKKNKNLTIKDFSVRITDCSEKTIQRELIALMAKGVLKKEGERRWSKYSLA